MISIIELTKKSNLIVLQMTQSEIKEHSFDKPLQNDHALLETTHLHILAMASWKCAPPHPVWKSVSPVFLVSATPLKPLNRISWNFVVIKDIMYRCAYPQEIFDSIFFPEKMSMVGLIWLNNYAFIFVFGSVSIIWYFLVCHSETDKIDTRKTLQLGKPNLQVIKKQYRW